MALAILCNNSEEIKIQTTPQQVMENSFRPSSDLAEFRKLGAAAKRGVVLTGAGVSAESGVPTFRGAGGFWRTYQVGSLTKGEE